MSRMRKVSGFFVSAGHAKALTTLPPSVAVSRKRELGTGEENQIRKRSREGGECGFTLDRELFTVFSAAGGVEFSGPPSSFSSPAFALWATAFLAQPIGVRLVAAFCISQRCPLQ